MDVVRVNLIVSPLGCRASLFTEREARVPQRRVHRRTLRVGVIFCRVFQGTYSLTLFAEG